MRGSILSLRGQRAEVLQRVAWLGEPQPAPADGQSGEVAKMLKRHFANIITYLRHPITNAVSEGLNSKIQAIKANARGCWVPASWDAGFR